jgi:hypothetical protein
MGKNGMMTAKIMKSSRRTVFLYWVKKTTAQSTCPAVETSRSAGSVPTKSDRMGMPIVVEPNPEIDSIICSKKMMM